MSTQSPYNPQSLQVHAILEQMVQQGNVTYQQAYNSFYQLQAQGKVPLLDWSKVKF